MDRAGLSTLGAEAESKYERLRADDAIASEVKESLRAEGLDVDGLERDFVSYGVVRTHLKDCLGAERSRESGNWEVDAIAIARNHTQRKVTEAVRSLENKGELAADGNITVHVDVLDLSMGYDGIENRPANRSTIYEAIVAATETRQSDDSAPNCSTLAFPPRRSTTSTRS